jgi:hypothetical protein
MLSYRCSGIEISHYVAISTLHTNLCVELTGEHVFSRDRFYADVTIYAIAY